SRASVSRESPVGGFSAAAGGGTGGTGGAPDDAASVLTRAARPASVLTSPLPESGRPAGPPDTASRAASRVAPGEGLPMACAGRLPQPELLPGDRPQGVGVGEQPGNRPRYASSRRSSPRSQANSRSMRTNSRSTSAYSGWPGGGRKSAGSAELERA